MNINWMLHIASSTASTFFRRKMLLHFWQKSVWIFHPVCHWYNYVHGGSQFMSIFVLPYAFLDITKMQVTFSKGFQLSSAALKFSSWQRPPSHRFHEQWQWVYFHFHTQPFPELAVRGLTLPRDTVSQRNSSVRRSWTRAANDGWAWLWKIFWFTKSRLIFQERKTTEQMLQSNEISFTRVHLTYKSNNIFLWETILSSGNWLSDV